MLCVKVSFQATLMFSYLFCVVWYYLLANYFANKMY